MWQRHIQYEHKNALKTKKHVWDSAIKILVHTATGINTIVPWDNEYEMAQAAPDVCVWWSVCMCTRAHFVYAYGCVSVSILLLRSSTSPLSATFSHLLATKMEKTPQKNKTKPGLTVSQSISGRPHWILMVVVYHSGWHHGFFCRDEIEIILRIVYIKLQYYVFNIFEANS